MCNPAILIGASTAITMAGQMYSGMAAAQSAKYGAKVAEQNKQLARESAADEISRGYDEQESLGKQIAQTVGSQKARLAANNVDTGFGSAAMVVDDTVEAGREDQKTLAENINRRVEGFQIDAWNYESQKRAKKFEAKNAKVSTALNVASTALGGAQQYGKYKASQG